MERPLTDHEKSDARRQAYEAWTKEMEAMHPLPEQPLSAPTPPLVRKLLMGIIASVPLILMFIMFTAVVVSADKTFEMFSATAASSNNVIWTTIIGGAAVILVEGSLVYVGFAKRAERLRDPSKRRRVMSVATIWQGVKVRLGMQAPPSHYEIGDRSLSTLGQLTFFVVICTNIVAVIFPYIVEWETSGNVEMTTSKYMTLFIGFVIGIIAPFGLHASGEQVAEHAFRLYAEDQERRQLSAQDNYRKWLLSQWEAVAEERITQALHRKFIMKNKMGLKESSPYLLVASNEEEEEGVSIDAFPLSDYKQ